MKQYESCLPGEYLKPLLMELSVAMDIETDFNKVVEAAKNDGKPGPQCVAIFRKGKTLILVDVGNRDWLRAIVVICEDEVSQNVKRIVLKWDTEARKFYHQEIVDDIEDVFGMEKSLLNCMIEVNKISIY